MSLPFRATVFLRPSAQGEPMTLMERHFAKELDAVIWCQVMTEAQPQATGLWFVAASQNGRTLSVARESGVTEAVIKMTRVPGAPEPELSEAEAEELGEGKAPPHVIDAIAASQDTTHAALAGL